MHDQALEVRKLGGSAQQLAETYFFETAVRLHRVGEGASYTGLKYESDFGPALTAAERTLETDSIKELDKLLGQALREGLSARFQAVQDARKDAARLGTVESQRERAEAELLFEKYVLGVYEAAAGEAVHAEGAATAGHQAAAVEPPSHGAGGGS
jgi:ribosomal protein L29